MHAQPSQTQHTTCPGVPHTHARDLRDGSRPHAHSSTRSSLGSTPLNAWPMRTRNTVSVELMPVPHSRGLANVKVTGNTAAIMGHPFFFSPSSPPQRSMVAPTIMGRARSHARLPTRGKHVRTYRAHKGIRCVAYAVIRLAQSGLKVLTCNPPPPNTERPPYAGLQTGATPSRTTGDCSSGPK